MRRHLALRVTLAALAAAALGAHVAQGATARSTAKLSPAGLVLQLWTFPTKDISAFDQTASKAIHGANGWETTYVAQATSGQIIVDSTVTVYRSAALAHAALLAVRVPGAKLVSKAGGLPTPDSRFFDRLAGGRDKWTIYWRSSPVVASISFDAAYIDQMSNFQNAGAFATREQKWMKAGGT